MSIALDRLVAEKVMGFDIETDGPFPAWQTAIDSPFFVKYHNRTAEHAPPFSTSIAAAWEVVEHLRKQTKADGSRKYLVSIFDYPNTFDVLVENLDTYGSTNAEVKSAPMAICLAALRAMNVPEATIQEACK